MNRELAKSEAGASELLTGSERIVNRELANSEPGASKYETGK